MVGCPVAVPLGANLVEHGCPPPVSSVNKLPFLPPIGILFGPPRRRIPRGRIRPGPRPFECCRKRQLSFPVSTISQWCAGRSSRAAVTFPSLNTDGHSENIRFVVTITDMPS